MTRYVVRRWLVDRLAALAVLTATVVLLGGCGYRPGGKGFKGSAETWPSTEFKPATLTLVDTRSGEELWTMDIPVGYHLVTKFVKDGGTDQFERPDRLEYEVLQLGTKYGVRHSAIAVPAANCRRWDVSYRPAPEYAEPGPRNGFFGNSPPWWDPKAGPLPDPDAKTDSIQTSR